MLPGNIIKLKVQSSNPQCLESFWTLSFGFWILDSQDVLVHLLGAFSHQGQAEALLSLAAAKSTLSKLKAQITSTFGGLPAAIGVDFSKLDTALRQGAE